MMKSLTLCLQQTLLFTLYCKVESLLFLKGKLILREQTKKQLQDVFNPLYNNSILNIIKFASHIILFKAELIFYCFESWSTAALNSWKINSENTNIIQTLNILLLSHQLYQ